MTHNTTPQSGTSSQSGKPKPTKPTPAEIRTARLISAGKLPPAPPPISLFAYPTLLPLSSTPEIKGALVYVIKHYGTDGLSVVVERKPVEKDVELNIRYGDWRGNKTDIAVDNQASRAALFFQDQYLKKTIELMRLMRMQAIQLYLVVGQTDLMLTDIRQHQHKLSGPGMVRDIFGRMLPTQDVKKVEHLDDVMLAAIDAGFGSYEGNLILKPSAFKTVERTELGLCPLYVEVLR